MSVVLPMVLGLIDALHQLARPPKDGNDERPRIKAMTARFIRASLQDLASRSRRRKSLWIAIPLVLALALPTLQATQVAVAQEDSPDTQQVQPGSADAELDQPDVAYIVRFSPGAASAQRSATLLSIDATSRGSVPQLSMEFVEFSAASHTQRAEALRNNPNVLSVELDVSRSIAAEPNDTEYAQQWSLPQVGWDMAYDTVTPIGSAVIAVLDTGIDGEHPDLADNVVSGVV